MKKQKQSSKRTGREKNKEGKGKKQVTERQLKYESLYTSKYIRKTDGKINNFNINITE